MPNQASRVIKLFFSNNYLETLTPEELNQPLYERAVSIMFRIFRAVMQGYKFVSIVQIENGQVRLMATDFKAFALAQEMPYHSARAEVVMYVVYGGEPQSLTTAQGTESDLDVLARLFP
jgi:hypothetical protein